MIALCEIPEVAVHRLRDIVIPIVHRHASPIGALVVVRPTTRRIVRGNRFLRVVGGVGCHAPVVPIRAHFGIYKKPVEDSKALGERMVIRGHVARKEQQRGITIGLRQIAEYLVVRAILLDHIEDVFDRRQSVARRDGIPVVGPHDARVQRGQR